MQLVLHPASAEQQNSGLMGDASDLHYNSMSCQSKTLHWYNHYIAGWFMARYCGIALQNMYTGVAHCRMCARVCKTCTRRGAKPVRCTMRGGLLENVYKEGGSLQ